LEAIFSRNVPWFGLFWLSEYFQTGSEKTQKLASSLKIFFSRTASSTREQFGNVLEALYQVCCRQLPVTDIFLIMLLRVRRYEKSKFH
jgi:hypothetical protein